MTLARKAGDAGPSDRLSETGADQLLKFAIGHRSVLVGSA